MPDKPRKMLFIGWDAADWKHIRPVMDAGHMPTLKSLMDGGVWGNIATMQPILSPMLWTSIATGKMAHKHGIHGFIEPMPDGKGIRPSTSTTRKCKAIWNILMQEGYKSHQVGWFCSHPAEPINGVYVTNMYDTISQDDHNKWTLPDGAVHPAELADTLEAIRLHPNDMEAAHILPFMPKAAEIEQDKERRFKMFRKLFCEMVNLHSATTWIMENQEWDFIATYNPAIDHFCHGFMQFHPPQMKGIPDKQFEYYKDVLTGVYRFHDMMLDRMLQLAGDDVTVVLCSDHGFHSDHLRPMRTPNEPAGPAVWHREYGIFVANGPGIRKGERVYGANVIDITPTILSLLKLPVGADMDGKPLLQILEDPPLGVARIDSWEDREGDAGMHAEDRREDPFEARQALEQLVELGYIDAPDENQERAAQNADREARYNLARACMQAGENEQGLELLTGLWTENPKELRFGLQLAQAQLTARQYSEARATAEAVLARGQEKADDFAAIAKKQRDAVEALIERQESGEDVDDPIDLSDEDQRKALLLYLNPEAKYEGDLPRGEDVHRVRFNTELLVKLENMVNRREWQARRIDVRVMPKAKLLLGTVAFHEKQPERALELLKEAEEGEPALPTLHLYLGKAYLRLKQNEDAERAFLRALQIDGDSAHAHSGIAAVYLRMNKPTLAADHALSAVGLLHHMPVAHFRLARALARLREYETCAQALEVCLTMRPKFQRGRRLLVRVYREKLNRPDMASKHTAIADKIREQRQST